MPLLHCVRHGETDGNRAARWQGHADEPLNATGRAEAEAAARALAAVPFDAAILSDLARARETGEAILARRAVPTTVDAAWREVDTGSWTGLTAAQAREADPEGWHDYAAGGAGWAGGETYEQLHTRIRVAVERVVAAHPSTASILVVTHAGAIRALAALALGATPAAARRDLAAVDHCALTTLVAERGHLLLRRYNVPLVPAAG